MCEKCRAAMTARTEKDQARRAQLLRSAAGGAGKRGGSARRGKKPFAAGPAAVAPAAHQGAVGKKGTGPKTVRHPGYVGGIKGTGPNTVAHPGYDGAAAGSDAANKKTCGCTRPHRPAASFRELVALVRLAEEHLSTLGGFTDPGERLAILRGIYYGTEWSLDYIREQSRVRNLAFCIYTGATTPADPRPSMPCGLYDALQKSQDTADNTRKLDVGHVFIGIDARRSWLARTRRIPTQGGTGLDISTWLGDLGGGAAMLALGRVKSPHLSALTKFVGGDFGGSSNLEGDIAGFVVALDESSLDAPTAPVFAAGKGVADVLEAYLEPAGPGKVWNGRARKMLRLLGGAVDASGALTNKAAVVDAVARQIEEFGGWYLVNRLRQKERLDVKLLKDAGVHLVGASREMSVAFIDALVRASQRSRINVAAAAPGPTPTAPGVIPDSLETAIGAIEHGQGTVDKVKDGWHKAGDYLKQLDFNPFD